MGTIKGGVLGPIQPLIGWIIAIVVITIFAGLALIGATASTAVVSTTVIMISFILIIGVVVAVAAMGSILRSS